MLGLAKTSPGPGNIALVERPPAHADSGQVVLEVLATGVCGTDLHIAAGEYACVPPVTLGHEICGRVVALGDGVAEAWLGMRVVCETFFATCGRCPACRDGRPNLCLGRRSLGTHVDGGFAARVVVPEVNLHPAPVGLTDAAAALTEPLACVCHCLFDPVAIVPGDRVLVVGPGPMGLLAGQVARAMGGEVTVAGLPTDEPRLAVARRLGLETTDDARGVGEVDVAIEASGASAGLAVGLAALRRGGHWIQLGIFGATIEVDLDRLLYHELEVRTGFAATPRAWRRALRLIALDHVQLEPLISDVVGLEAWPDAFAVLRTSHALKVVLDPRR
jgi:L-iditol 2-dehydrogenase